MRKTTLVGIIFVGVILLSASSIMGTSSIQEVRSQGIQPLGSNWLECWSYRKTHNITGSTAQELLNYPIVLNLHYDNGVDVEGNVYLNGKCKPNFGDIRFTDSSGTQLDYWIQQKTEGVRAIFWVEIGHIPEYPDNATLYTYYGNSNASSTSNKDWTFDLADTFEDGTTQGWIKSWYTFVTWDGVSAQAFRGNYSRGAGKIYGSDNAGNGNFYEHFQKFAYLSSGSYLIEGAARFEKQNQYHTPQSIKLTVNTTTVDTVSSPGTQWYSMGSNFTILTASVVELDVEFHLLTQGLGDGDHSFYIDELLIRKWCDPEPTHGGWSSEETPVDDDTPPQIHSVDWKSTVPYPFVESSIPRHTEPVVVTANVSDEVDGSGVAFVHVSYRVNSSQWWWTTMTYNVSNGLWTTTIPGQLGNSSVEFFIGTSDFAGNLQESSLLSYDVQHLIVGDLNGDGIVDIFDIVRAASHYGESW